MVKHGITIPPPQGGFSLEKRTVHHGLVLILQFDLSPGTLGESFRLQDGYKSMALATCARFEPR